MKECTKTKFANEEAAKHAIRQIAKKNPDGKRPTRAYKCSMCDLWHLTSRPDIEVINEENNNLKKQIADLKHEIYLLNYEKTLMTKQERNEIKREELYQQLKLQNIASQKTNKRLRQDNRELLETIIKLQNKIEKLENNVNNENGQHPLS